MCREGQATHTYRPSTGNAALFIPSLNYLIGALLADTDPTRWMSSRRRVCSIFNQNSVLIRCGIISPEICHSAKGGTAWLSSESEKLPAHILPERCMDAAYGNSGRGCRSNILSQNSGGPVRKGFREAIKDYPKAGRNPMKYALLTNVP